MNDYVVIIYNGEQVSVPKEVADFLEQDRKRQQAQDKQDTRHLSKSEFETVPSGSDCVRRPVEDAALRNLQLENLRKAIAERRALCAKDARGLLGVLVLSDQHKGIGFLAVHPEARGRGIASALVRMMLDVLPADQDIFVTTYREDDPLGAAPRALYKRLGFEEAELVTRYGYPCQQFVLRRGSGDK